jgi:prevent-host-death family protein
MRRRCLCAHGVDQAEGVMGLAESGSMWPQMPERIGIRELRDNLTATIRRVRAGETIEITHHRERVAVLAPVRERRIEQLGQASDIVQGKPLGRPLRRFPASSGLTANDALEEDRAER